jgi:hypothetical protein
VCIPPDAGSGHQVGGGNPFRHEPSVRPMVHDRQPALRGELAHDRSTRGTSGRALPPSERLRAGGRPFGRLARDPGAARRASACWSANVAGL